MLEERAEPTLPRHRGALLWTRDAPRLRWSLLVWSVPRETSHEVKGLLAAEGIARLKEWLQTKARISQTRQSFLVSYDEAGNQLTYDATIS